MSYGDYYDKKKEDGEAFQDFVQDQFWTLGVAIQNYTSKEWQQKRGENRAGIEIKLDDQYAETGNLYIEVAEKSDPGNPEYVPSGIRREGVWLLVIGNYKTIFVFSVKILEMLIVEYELKKVTTPTSIGYLLPDEVAIRYAAKVIAP